MNTKIDINIVGSGTVPSGEYSKISVSGSGRILGNIRCESFSSAGSVKVDSILCDGILKVSGNARFFGDIKALSAKTAGVFKCDGSLEISEGLTFSGSAKCEKNIKCEHLGVSGILDVGGGIEAESVKISGFVNCAGLINADNIEIRFDKGMCIGSIGGSKIVIVSERIIKSIQRLPLLSSLTRSVSSFVEVESLIEGDEIAIECVKCPRVSGRVVAIGQGCSIDLVQYSEDIEISPNATVGRYEKI